MADLPPPGWYEDPTSPVLERWWDGERWSEQTRRREIQGPRVPSGQLRNMGDLLSHTFGIIGSRWDDMLLVAVLAGLLQGLAAVLLLRPIADAIDIVNDQIVGWGSTQTLQVSFFALVAIAIALVTALAHYRLAWESVSDTPSSWSGAFQFGLANMPRFVAWALLALLPVIGAFVFAAIVARVNGAGALFLIAFFFAAVWWGVAVSFMPFAIASQPAGTNPIRTALRIVKGRWWKVFGRIVLVGLMAGIISGAIGAIVGRLTGNDFFGFVITDRGNGEFEVVKDLSGPVNFFITNSVVFMYSVASGVLQIAAITSIAFDATKEPERELGY